MALYSEQYRYRGLSKGDLRKIWEEMFTGYDNLASTHTFSRIHVGGSAKQPTADISCTGSLWGLSKETGDRKSTRLNSSHIQKSRMPSSA